MILALTCLVLAGFDVKASRVNLLGIGLALWVLAELLDMKSVP
jgi:hypothetical protein